MRWPQAIGLLRFFLSPGAARPIKALANDKATRPRLVRACASRSPCAFERAGQGQKARDGERKNAAFPFLSFGGRKNGFKMPSAVFLRKMRRMGGVFVFLSLFAFLERVRGVNFG